MNILRINASPRLQSLSYQLSNELVEMLTMTNAGCQIETVNVYELPHVDCPYAESLINRSGDKFESVSVSLSDQLIAQLEHADIIVLATPMHNFSVPSALKAWIDHVVRIGKTFQATPNGKVGTLVDRPVYIAITSGGLLSGERKQPDFLTDYLRVIFQTIGITSLHFFVVEGTVMGDEHLQQQLTQYRAAIVAN